MRLRDFSIFLYLVTLAAAPVSPKGTLQAILARMDKAAVTFKAMSSQVTYVTHTEVLDENNTETGTVTMKKVQAGEVQGLIDFVTPDKRTVAFEKRRLRIYYPKIKTVQEFDLGKHGEQLDQFLMIGFGTSGTALAKDYDMKVLGEETVKGEENVPAIRVELIPKTGDVRQYITRMELWIAAGGDPYPLQEKISQPSGDYRLVTYHDLKINPPLKTDALQLKLPSGVKTEYPGK